MPKVSTVKPQSIFAYIANDGIQSGKDLFSILRQPTPQHHRIRGSKHRKLDFDFEPGRELFRDRQELHADPYADDPLEPTMALRWVL